jgi:hypothetical protein
MKEAIGKDVFSFPCCVITTNGVVKSNRHAVMGKGIALQALNRWRGIDLVLGTKIINYGNHSAYLGMWTGHNVFSMPTKNHWRDVSSPELVIRSATELVEVVNKLDFDEEIGMPPPGCGCGGLTWDVVKELLKDILDDRFVICTRK